MSNYLKPEKVKQVVEHIEKGNGIRKTSKETGVAKNTVTKIQRVVIAEKITTDEVIPICKCGQPVGHKGWCSYRLAESPKRQEFLMEKWGKLTFDDIARKQREILGQKKIEIQDEIKKLMAKFTRIDTKLCFLEEYLDTGCSVDDESDEAMEEQYIEAIIEDWKEQKSKE